MSDPSNDKRGGFGGDRGGFGGNRGGFGGFDGGFGKRGGFGGGFGGSSSLSVKDLTDYYTREGKGQTAEDFFLQFSFKVDGGSKFGCRFCHKQEFSAAKGFVNAVKNHLVHCNQFYQQYEGGNIDNYLSKQRPALKLPSIELKQIFKFESMPSLFIEPETNRAVIAFSKPNEGTFQELIKLCELQLDTSQPSPSSLTQPKRPITQADSPLSHSLVTTSNQKRSVTALFQSPNKTRHPQGNLIRLQQKVTCGETITFDEGMLNLFYVLINFYQNCSF